MQKPPKRPRDPNQLGKLIVDLSVGDTEEKPVLEERKNPAAVTLGRKGGEARAATLSAKKRKEIATKAARSRWKSK